MKYGLIAKQISHSFSKVIHTMIGAYDYELFELCEDELCDFFEKRDFLGINVTIPYKERIIPLLDFVDGAARDIGAVNTVINRGGKLYGYNTDFYGLSSLLKHAKISLAGRKVAILGTGGTSKTATAVAKSLGAREILRVSRSEREGAVSYEHLKRENADVEVIINTTPVGMFPKNYDTPLPLSPFSKLCGVVDVVYNPLRTPFVLEAKKRGIAAEGGLYMLVAQAVRASEIFLGNEVSDSTELIDEIYKKLLSEKENIVLVGMPSSGKTTVGKLLAEELGREVVDTDEHTVEKIKMSIKEYFDTHGEESFRDKETESVKECATRLSTVIATGGGVVMREENVDALRQNGRIYLLDRPLTLLTPTADRPTALNAEAMKALYKKRIDFYRAAADVTLDASGEPHTICEMIRKDFGL